MKDRADKRETTKEEELILKKVEDFISDLYENNFKGERLYRVIDCSMNIIVVSIVRIVLNLFKDEKVDMDKFIDYVCLISKEKIEELFSSKNENIH